MSRQDARDQARADLLTTGRRDSANYESNVACYRRWCLANGYPAEPPPRPWPWPANYPGPTQIIIRFLHAEYVAGEKPRWASNTVTSIIRDVSTELRGLGHGDAVDGDLLGRYRRRVTDELGKTRLRPVDALTKEQVAAAPVRAEEEVHPLSAATVRLRGVIAVADALGLDPLSTSSIQGMHRDAFVRRGDTLVMPADLGPQRKPDPDICQFPTGCTRRPRARTGIGPAPRYCQQRDHQSGPLHTTKSASNLRARARKAGAPGPTKAAKAGRPPRVVLAAERQPEMYASLIAALDAAGDAEYPLAPAVEDGDIRTDADRLKADRSALRGAWLRACPTLPGNDGKPRLAEVRRQVAASTADDRVWWLAQADEWLWMRRRDAAYALAGINAARRHIELQRALLGDLTPVDAGYEYVVRDHKGNKIARIFGGKEVLLIRVIGHLADDPADCQAHCPACAMRGHREVRDRSGAGADDPLFVGLDGTVLGRDGGNYVIKRLAELVEDLGYNPDGTPRSFSTRTLRATGATLARRGGMSYRQIADEVTGHRSEDQAALYVRRHDAFSVELVLSLDGSQRPSAAD